MLLKFHPLFQAHMADILSSCVFFLLLLLLLKKNADPCEGLKGCSDCQKCSIKTERPPVLAHPIEKSGAGKFVCLSLSLSLFLLFFC